MPNPVDIDELLARVRDEASFILFIEALGADFARERLLEQASPSSPYGPGALGWENASVDAFLDAAAAWAASSTRPAQAAPVVSNVWQRCAAILLAGKFYE
ncbi:hypothetical protein ACI77J_27835 [Pseudomonas sp. O64]|uniref:DUF7660 family protein n=1 Tax=unclassified Pseudomonas TaxID=196821 RepID=UPI001F55B287|nr:MULTISPECIES: hypothetical protein [unclassified Pseudomonas]UNM18170.1 hypothetical protein K0P33_21855 [Pseudomonas sp. ArH3a]UXZ20955.1 hypothetical protein KZH41_20960 [Pseudomonas sp. YeP6b]